MVKKKQHIDFYVFYEIDEQESEHALSLNNHHKEDTGDADHQRWVLLEV